MSNPFAPRNGFTQTKSTNITEEFKQFAQTFKGNPKQEVDRLLNSGEMTQQQFDFLVGEVQRRFPFLNAGAMRR